ncbi:MAG: hypothetical protein ABI448_10560 [Bacteroidia bacterium]
MKKIVFVLIVLMISYTTQAQSCDKGCGKLIKTEPTTIKGVKPNRALLIFKYYGPDGKPAKSHMTLILDGKDTLHPTINKLGTSKLMVQPGIHKLKFKANFWYSVKMDKVTVKDKNTYTYLIRFEAEEIGTAKTKGTD